MDIRLHSTMAETTFELWPSGLYSLAASIKFLEGFTPAAYEGSGADILRLAFTADGGEEPAGVMVRSEDGVILGEVYGDADTGTVREQVARILSLDVDGSGFPEVGDRDPIVEGLQERYPGLRPVCFNSPYEAAVWAIIGHRIRIVQAARIKARLAEELGPAVDVDGETLRAFPAPSRLSRLESFPGLFGRKVDYLQSLAKAAIQGKLDAAHLRSLAVEEALNELMKLPGIGPFSAELILLRGAGEPDYLPTKEPRLARAVAMAYGLDEPPDLETLSEIAERWRSYRTWVAVHLRAMLEEETAEIGGARIG
ncbi:DNA-3-methyladenine glycosylase [soil metagenome]